MLTQARLRELLHYDPESGVFTWIAKSSPCSHIRPGDIAGWDDDGYVKIKLDGRDYKAHRLAWLYMHGQWPSRFIDHKDTDRSNNRFLNLRDASCAINMQNQTKAHANNRSCGLLGVTFHKQSGRWAAKLAINGKRLFGGLHDTPGQAHTAYLTLKRAHHPGFVE